MADVVQAQNRDPMDQSTRGSEPLAGRSLPSNAHTSLVPTHLGLRRWSRAVIMSLRLRGWKQGASGLEESPWTQRVQGSC